MRFRATPSTHQHTPPFSSYVGLPFAERGRDRNGLDCWGLVCVFYQEQYGIELPSFAGDYTNIRDALGIASLVETEKCNWVKQQYAESGDVVIFKIRQDWGHVGIMLDQRSFLHIFGKRTGSTVERLTGMFHAKPYEFYRHPNFK